MVWFLYDNDLRHERVKSKTRLGNKFHFKDQIPKDFISGVVYKFQCGLCNESCYGKWYETLEC